MSEDIFDFGFTAVTVDELEVIQEANAQLESTSADAEMYRTRLTKVYNAIQPLLNNLAANPEKEYLYWPDRVSKVESFSDHLRSLYDGTK